MNTLHDKVRSALEDLLGKNCDIKYPPNSHTDPLFLILKTNHNLIGFAMLDNQPQEDFSKAFQDFKQLYTMHSKEWVNFDLTLILCKASAGAASDEFCNEIELNPYFCRKLVIGLDNLRADLERLPFMPLHLKTVGGQGDLLTAQTYLMSQNVPADLARYLAVPHVRRAERIIEECIAGALGKPELAKAKIRDIVREERISDSGASIKRLVINNFRAYRGKHEFDLDANLVVLFGPNGFGKTSFFDAVDFVCTGGVARFDERLSRQTDRRIKALRHLDSLGDDCFVEAEISKNGRPMRLKRYMKNWARADVDGITKSRKEILMELVGEAEEASDIRIDNLADLFRGIHFFGQEYQTLTPEFRKDSSLDGETVSRMLALQDYVESIKKAGEVFQQLRRQIEEKESAISLLKISLESRKTEMGQLERSARMLEEPAIVSEMGKDLVKKIISEADIPIEVPEKFSEETVRNWRTKITVQRSRISQALDAVEELEKRLPELSKNREELRRKSSELVHRKGLLSGIEKTYAERKRTLEESTQEVNEMLLKARRLSLRKENLNWLGQARTEFERLKEQLTAEGGKFRAIQSKFLGLVSNMEKLELEREAVKEKIGKITSETEALNGVLKQLCDLEKSVDDWSESVNQAKELTARLQKAQQEIVSLESDLRTRKDELSTAVKSQRELSKQLDILQKFRSELEVSLDAIEEHIASNICPVCGTSHQSREDLIGKLRAQRRTQPKEIQEALKSLESAKARTSKLDESVSSLELGLEQRRQGLANIQKELSDAGLRIEAYQKKAATLGVPMPSGDLASAIVSKKEDILSQVNAKQQELIEQELLIKRCAERLTILSVEKESLEKKSRTIGARQEQLRSSLDKIRDDASSRLVSLEFDEQENRHELIQTNTKLEDLHKQMEKEQTENQSLQEEVSILQGKIETTEAETQVLDEKIIDLRKRIQEVESLLRRRHLDLDASMDQVLVAKRDLTNRLANLDALQDEIINFEIALNSAEMSATLARLRQETENINKQSQDKQEEQKKLGKWMTHFDKIHRKLQHMRDRQLKEYIEKYGPLTSNIQRRLRSVYSFGDIKLLTSGGELRIRVERRTEHSLFPTDYFSESQIQILMLSLFLSATLTQTWSSFAPTVLDDPVTHFDDMNTYSLIDLIGGLIAEPGKKRQFIISTCEERFFQLMRQRFSKMDGGAIFYVFESIGEDGPKVQRL